MYNRIGQCLLLPIIFWNLEVVSVSWAQENPNPSPVTIASDQSWADLQLNTLVVNQDTTAADYLTEANRWRKFSTDYPQSARAKTAKRLEAVNLIRAAQNGDHGSDTRWVDLVSELRNDQDLPSRDRYQMVVMADFLEVQIQPGLGALGRIAGYERVARKLIQDFPGEPGGYESMLAVARNTQPSKGRGLAQELLGTAAQNEVKNEARILIGRYELVGTNILDRLNHAGSSFDLNPELPTVIYAWATWNPRSMAQAVWLKKQAAQVNLIGLCLDTDIVKARKTGEALSDRQVYDEKGRKGTLAEALFLTDAGWVYQVSRDGVVLNVRVQDRLSAVQKY